MRPRPAWYALDRGGWRDYVTLLHPPYTAWHLAYVVVGGCLAPVVRWERLGAVVLAFALAMGIGAHALDETRGRPLQTKIPGRVLVALAVVSIGAACAIGVAGAAAWGWWLLLLVAAGAFLFVTYNLELFGGRVVTNLELFGGRLHLLGIALGPTSMTATGATASARIITLTTQTRAQTGDRTKADDMVLPLMAASCIAPRGSSLSRAVPAQSFQ